MKELVIEGVPIVWRNPFVGSRGAFSYHTPIKNQLRDVIQDLWIHPIFDEAIAIDIFFVLPMLKSISKKKERLMLSNELRPVKRPDRGNMMKFAEDLLSGIVVKDDSMIVDGRVTKYFGEVPKTIFRIYPIQEYVTLLSSCYLTTAP